MLSQDDIKQIRQVLGEEIESRTRTIVKEELKPINIELGKINSELGTINKDIDNINNELVIINKDIGKIKKDLSKIKKDITGIKQNQEDITDWLYDEDNKIKIRLSALEKAQGVHL